MDIVYKYRPLSDEKGRIPKNTLSVLSGNMYFAPPSSFKNNDPEDVRVPISFDGTDGQIKNYLFERFKGGHISESEYEELKLNPQKLKEHINNSSDKKRRDVFGVFCVGKTWDNLHTWRTFGLNSDCVAVGFRCIHDEKLKKDFLPLLKNQSDTGLPFDDISVLYDVKYTDTPIEPFEIITRSYEEYLAFIRNVIITKRTIFEPEDEKRAIILRSHFVQYLIYQRLILFHHIQ